MPIVGGSVLNKCYQNNARHWSAALFENAKQYFPTSQSRWRALNSLAERER